MKRAYSTEKTNLTEQNPGLQEYMTRKLGLRVVTSKAWTNADLLFPRQNSSYP